ncbi:MAG: hypothetical protein EZS28_047729, partial [Streblomastix strix]
DGINFKVFETEQPDMTIVIATFGTATGGGEDDALLLLKADQTQLIDSYTKGEDDALLLLKADKSTTYTKIETDQLISQIEVGDIYLTDYVTLGTFVKSDAEDSIVLLGAGGTKPISEFAGVPTDLSNYYTKTQTYSKTETNNKYVRLEGSIQQTIIGRLKYISPFGQIYDETQDQVANTYLTMSEIDSKLTNYVKTVNNQEIYGTKTFNANVNATEFVKTGKG